MPQGLSDSTWVLELPYVKPPLSANYRQHWRQRHSLEQNVQNAVIVIARQASIPALGRCRVQLHYRPTSNRRRDTDNVVPTLKPVCDGLVRAGVVPDDTPEFMSKPEPIIHPWARRDTFPLRPVLWVEITDQSHLDHVQIMTHEGEVVRNDWVEPVSAYDKGGRLHPGVSVVTNTSGVAERVLPVDHAGSSR